MGRVANIAVKVAFALYFSKQMVFALAINVFFVYRLFSQTAEGKKAVSRLEKIPREKMYL